LTLGPDDLVLFSGPWLHREFKLGIASRATHVSAVREFYQHQKRLGRASSNLADSLEYPKAGFRIPRVMKLAHAEKLLWAPDMSRFMGVRDATMLALLMGCGLRVSGLCSLNVSNVVSDHVEGRPRLFLHVTEKGDRDRVMPIPRDAEFLLRLYLEHPELKEIERGLSDGDQVLFVTTNPGPLPKHDWVGERRRMTRKAVLSMIKMYAKRVGIPLGEAHPHAIRHLFGTELAEEDVDAKLRQDAMGHADPKSTAIYTHTARRKMTREIDRANPLAKFKTPATALLQRLDALTTTKPRTNSHDDAHKPTKG
jgi:site-specific recombinase XerD